MSLRDRVEKVNEKALAIVEEALDSTDEYKRLDAAQTVVRSLSQMLLIKDDADRERWADTIVDRKGEIRPAKERTRCDKCGTERVQQKDGDECFTSTCGGTMRKVTEKGERE